jgi:hypothetical protein
LFQFRNKQTYGCLVFETKEARWNLTTQVRAGIISAALHGAKQLDPREYGNFGPDRIRLPRRQ